MNPTPSPERPGPPKCLTCDGLGVIPFTCGQTPESFEQGEYPCPDCATRTAPEAVAGERKPVRFRGEIGETLCRGCESPLIGTEIPMGVCAGCAVVPATRVLDKERQVSELTARIAELETELAEETEEPIHICGSTRYRLTWGGSEIAEVTGRELWEAWTQLAEARKDSAQKGEQQ